MGAATLPMEGFRATLQYKIKQPDCNALCAKIAPTLNRINPACCCNPIDTIQIHCCVLCR
jgi:hypothetical protein